MGFSQGCTDTATPTKSPSQPRGHASVLHSILPRKELHGYALVQAMAYLTDGLVALAPGNLYRVVKRLLALGGRVVAAEIARLQALSRSRTPPVAKETRHPERRAHRGLLFDVSPVDA